MRVVTIALCTTAALAGATAAQAAPLEARNPFHCSIAMQVSYELAKDARGAEDPLTKELHSRLVFQAFAAARFPKALDSEEEAATLSKQLSEDAETAFALTEACMRRQDASPRFRQARLQKQVDGLPEAPVSAHASLTELKGLFQAQR